MKDKMQEDIVAFFRAFALQVLAHAHVDPNDPYGVKMALLDHYEEIYPSFSLTPVFRANYHKRRHAEMVDEYRRCFSMLLMGRLPD